MSPNRRILSAAAIAMAVKLVLAWNTYGTNDVMGWERFQNKAATDGALALYRDGVGIDAMPFIHPPFTLRMTSVWAQLASTTGIPFPFWLRATGAAADFGSVFLLLHLNLPAASVMLIAVSPVTLFITGFHGNTDPILVFWLVLSVWIATRRGAGVLAGIALGMAVNTKVIALIFVPMLMMSASGIGGAIGAGAAVALTYAGGSAPYIWQDPRLLVSTIFGYPSQYGYWGLTRIFNIADDLFEPAKFFTWTYYLLGRYIVLGTIVVYAWKLRTSAVSIFVKAAVTMLIFMTLTFGFGVQYLAWIVPWTAAARYRVSVAFHVVTGVFLFGVYTLWSGGLPWHTANALERGLWHGPWLAVELASWVTVVWMLRDVLQRPEIPRPPIPLRK